MFYVYMRACTVISIVLKLGCMLVLHHACLCILQLLVCVDSLLTVVVQCVSCEFLNKINKPQTVYSIGVDLPFSSSDHCCVNFAVALETNEQPHSNSNTKKCYQWCDADYNGMSDYLTGIDWQYLLSVNLTADSLWAAFHSVLLEAIELHVPSVIMNCNGTKCSRHYPKEIRKALARKRCVWRKSRLEPSNTVLLQKYRDLAQQCRHLLHEYEVKLESRVICKENTGAFYKHVNRRMACRSGIGVLKNPDGSLVTNDTDKAEVLNNYFASVCTTDDGCLPNFDRVVPEDTLLSEVTFTPTLVKRAIKKMKNNTSSGPDGLPPALFKKLINVLASPLSLLYSSLMSVGKVPDAWRSAIVTPVSKGGIASDITNYRPISLTSVACKIMERIIVWNMLDFFHQNGSINKQQHGFLSGKSTCTNLLEQLNDWTLAIDDKNMITVGYVDFAKAFDSISHQKLCQKLQGYGVGGKLLDWINDFLRGRSQCVRVGNGISSNLPLISGIVQGSCIGPLLFVIYINDIVNMFDSDCTCKLYADDMKLYSRIRTNDCKLKFQECLDRLTEWSNIWQLKISYQKCAIMNIGANCLSSDSTYCLGQQPLATVKVAKDLGVLIDNNLKFDLHISKIVSRASARANLIHKCFISKHTDTLVKAFVTYVRPLLEYASTAWSPYLIKDTVHIEAVQRHFTKRLRGLGTLSYPDRLKATGLECLELRRLQLDLIYTYKILFGLVCIDVDSLFTVRTESTTRGHALKLYLPACRTNARKHYFAIRVIEPWNSLKLQADHLSSVRSFTTFIRTADLKRFLHMHNN